MTENEWLTATAPDAMLAHLRRQLPSTGNERKLLFFAIGCGRLCWERMDSSSRMVVEWMERMANGQEKAARPDHLFRTFAKALGGPIEIINRIVGFSRIGAWTLADTFVELSRVQGVQSNDQSDLLRDIIGNPFQSVTFDPSWRTEAVTALVETIRTDGRHDQYPILGDALIDAGCRELLMTDHCHQPGTHFRGCWVVEGILSRND